MIIRYKMESIGRGSGHGGFMEPASNGQWIRYEDHTKVVDQLRHQILELETALDNYGDDGEE